MAHDKQPSKDWFRKQVIDLQKGNPAKRKKILASLARELLPILYRIAALQQRRTWLGAYDPDIAQEAVSQAYVKFLARLDAFQEPYDIVAWFRLVMLNCLRDEQQRRYRVTYTDVNSLLEGVSCDSSELLSLAPEVRELVKKLPPEQKKAIYLHFWRGFTVGEIAEMCGTGHQAITNRITRAKAKLKLALEAKKIDVERWADTHTS